MFGVIRRFHLRISFRGKLGEAVIPSSAGASASALQAYATSFLCICPTLAFLVNEVMAYHTPVADVAVSL